MTNAFFFNPMTQPPIAGDQLELKLSAIVHRQIDFLGMSARLASFVGGAVDSIDDTHRGNFTSFAFTEASKILAFIGRRNGS